MAVNTQITRKGGMGNSFFVLLFFLPIIAALCITLYETFMQKYSAESSILSYAHSHDFLKGYSLIYEPGKGVWHLIGWIGSAMMVLMMLYSVRKRFSFMSDLGSLRRWLGAHMFLGIMGPLLVTFHTTFKFGGIIATSFWCMLITVLFGILGRYIYVQIPRNMSGAELAAGEIDMLVETLDKEMNMFVNNASISDLFKGIATSDEKAKELNTIGAMVFMMKTDIINRFRILPIRRALKTSYKLSWQQRGEIMHLMKRKAALIRKKNFLAASHRLLHYWHVFHIPLAVVMFIIMFLHIIVYYLFRAMY